MCAVFQMTQFFLQLWVLTALSFLVYSVETASLTKKEREKKNLSVKSKKYDTNHLNIIFQKASSILRTCRVSEDAIHKEGKTSYIAILSHSHHLCASDYYFWEYMGMANYIYRQQIYICMWIGYLLHYLYRKGGNYLYTVYQKKTLSVQAVVHTQ